MKKILIISIIILACNDLIGQKSKTPEMYNWGTGWSYDSSNVSIVNEECVEKLQEFYGFKFKYIKVSEITANKIKRWEKHNKKVDDKIVQIHGLSWRKEYIEKLKKCSK